MNNLSAYPAVTPCIVPLGKVLFPDAEILLRKRKFLLSQAATLKPACELLAEGQSNYQFLIWAVRTGLVQVNISLQ